MKSFKYSILFFTFFALFTRCTPDFSPNADSKDITVVYGLLNVKDSLQYLKIYKAFLVDGNAIVAAQDINNFSYFDKIEASMDEYINNQYVRTISFDTTMAIPKNSGIFAHPTQVLYYTDEVLNENAVYKLTVKNKETGKIITSETPLVQGFIVTLPTVQRINLTSDRVNYIRSSAAPNAAAYDCYLNFYYIEVDVNTGDTVKRGSVSWKVGRDRKSAVNTPYVPKNMYSIIAGSLKSDPSVLRYARFPNCLEIEIWAAEENYLTYLDVNTPSSSVVQDKLDFSNMKTDDNSALGVFSSRIKTTRVFDISPASHDTLRYGSATKHLGFR